MRPLLFFFLAFFVAFKDSDASRISPELNKLVQEKCGKTFFHRKVINGTPTQLGDHPWAASVYVKRTRSEVLLGPGTIISPRHILFMNLVRSKNGTLTILNHPLRSLGTCEGAHLVLPTEANSKFDVDFEFLKPNVLYNRVFDNIVDRITVINGCKHLGHDNLMILGLNRNLHFNKTRNAACLSNSPKLWDQMDEFKMFGVNETGIQVEGSFEPVNCTADYPYSCAKAVNSYQGLCTGDFGGSAVTKIGKQSTVLGMYASGNVKCDADPTKIKEYRYINVGYFRKEICEATGVCRDAPDDETVETVTAVGEPIYVTEPVTAIAVGEPVLVTDDVREETTVVYAEPDSDVRTTMVYAEPDSDPRTTADYAAPDSSIRQATTPSSSSEEVSSPPSSSEESATTEPLSAVAVAPLETIVSETFEKMKINGSCAEEHSGHVKNIHIHIHLEK